ncbi:ras-related rab-4 [Stylonychia lemnae]|uniref:Ras-related rab-4 n=1 Tax=Stylonychia lemnae TaxID=5949 RepID=A0A077ZXP9_STYLE|nr:ras-related rab-4 [Stylonychia lemnae]|eukprot:CDW74685.1 ras-related rab-4 [Stylonychia lemnae]
MNPIGGQQHQELDDYHFKFKISIVGDSGVGKTTFLDAISSTLGSVVENEQSSELHIKTTFYIDDAYQYKIVYFDMPGKERHHKYIHKYVNGSTAILFLFDTTKRTSFEKAEQWINDCEKCDIPIKILVGNKIDLSMTKKNLINPVTKVEAVALARKYGMEYFETCSVGEASIVQVFDHLFNSLLSLIPNPPDPEQLMGKNVVLGKRVLNDVKFKLSLAELLPNYD